MARFLILDTSGDEALVLVRDGHRHAERRWHGYARHSDRVLVELTAVLQAMGWARMPRWDAIAYVAGPGAFTGIRLACAVAQGLAIAQGAPMIALETLALVALAAVAERGNEMSRAPAINVLALADARMGQVYAAAYRLQGKDFAAFSSGVPSRSGATNAKASSADAQAASPSPVAEQNRCVDGLCRRLAAPIVAAPEDLPSPQDWEIAPELTTAPWLLACRDVGEETVARLSLAWRQRIALVPPVTRWPTEVLLAATDVAWREGAARSPSEALPYYVRERVALTAAEQAARRAANVQA